jgi:hypothetical protein
MLFYVIAVGALVITVAIWREFRIVREQRRHVESKKNEPLRGTVPHLRPVRPESEIEAFLDTVSPTDAKPE